MPSSALRVFSDPDDYAAAIRGTKAEVTLTGRGDFAGKIVRIDLDRLWMQRFFDNLPRIGHSAATGARAAFSFRTDPGPSLLWGPSEMLPTNIVRHGSGEGFQHSSGAASWAAISLAVADMASLGETLVGLDLTPPRDARMVTPPPAAMARLQRLHAAAAHLAETAPEIIANPDAARGLEQALVAALLDCLASGQQRENAVAGGQHAIVMRRFRRVIEENPDDPLYIPEIARAIRVPERTLRLCCQEHLGISPKRYLMLRRMHLARRALRMSAPEATTVTGVATRYGFWQLGRFAVEYRRLFAEAPSATLQR
jgi:AraC-like DNA-binding protein